MDENERMKCDQCGNIDESGTGEDFFEWSFYDGSKGTYCYDCAEKAEPKK